ncbi:MAG: 50S ribosomal protein L23 [Leptospirales bacterium]|nr:50S ribosomal protein L23 [Leptospirales bacterium]
MNPNDIIIRPIISEKSTASMEINKYVFEVPIKANKVMVRQAVTAIFGVQPASVNVLVVRGRRRRVRFRVGKTAAWKKAIVTLKAGDKINVFES